MVTTQNKIRSGSGVPPLIGLTGGIGSGKSSVSACFATLGVPVVDTDLIAHHLTTSGGAAIGAIKEYFGEKFFNKEGNLDRPLMRRHVFSNPKDKKKLEEIMHPLIEAAVKQELKHNLYAPYIIIDIPLLRETGFFKKWLTRILVVESRLDLQIQRAMDRSGYDPKEVKLILKAQATDEQRKEIATEVIANNDTLEELHRQVNRIHQHYLKTL